jgi:hypothetical protein
MLSHVSSIVMLEVIMIIIAMQNNIMLSILAPLSGLFIFKQVSNN